MFVPETHDMSQFMDHNAKLVAVLADTDGLRTTSSFSHKGTTTATDKKLVISAINLLQQYLIVVHHLCRK